MNQPPAPFQALMKGGGYVLIKEFFVEKFSIQILSSMMPQASSCHGMSNKCQGKMITFDKINTG